MIYLPLESVWINEKQITSMDIHHADEWYGLFKTRLRFTHWEIRLWVSGKGPYVFVKRETEEECRLIAYNFSESLNRG